MYLKKTFHENILKSKRSTDFNVKVKWIVFARCSCVHIYTCTRWSWVESYIFIPTMHLKARGCYGNASNCWCFWLKKQKKNIHSGTVAGSSNQNNRPSHCPTAQGETTWHGPDTPSDRGAGPLFWLWIWLIGSLLAQAFVMPNRQLTERRRTKSLK